MKNLIKTAKRTLAIALSATVCLSTLVFGSLSVSALDPMAEGAKGADLSYSHGYYNGNAAAEMKNAGWVSYLFNNPTTPETAVSYTGAQDIATNFAIDNGGNNNGFLKVIDGKISSDQYASITYPYMRFKNFRAEYNVAVGWTRAGIMIGENGVFPLSRDNNETNDTGLVIFAETDGQVNIGGAVVAGSGRSIGAGETLGTQDGLSGTNNIRANTAGMVKGLTVPPYLKPEDNCYENGTRTIVVEVANGLVTVWDKSTPKSRVSARLTEYYAGGCISFFTNHNNNSFISVKVTALNDYDFEYGAQYWKSNAGDFNDRMYAYTFDRATYTKQSEGTFSSLTTGEGNGASSNGYLKYNKTDNLLTAFTYTEKRVIDFKAKISVLPSYDYNGLMFGAEKGAFALGSASTSDDTGVIIRSDSNGSLLIIGAIDKSTVKTSGSNVTAASHSNGDFPNNDGGLSVSGLTSYVDAEGATQKKSVNIIEFTNGEGLDTQIFSFCVEVIGGTLKIWEESYPQNYVTVGLNNNYVGGYVSMFSRTHNNGSFRGLSVTDLGGSASYKFNLANINTLDQNFESYYFANQYATPVKADKVSDQWWVTDAYNDTKNPDYGNIHGAYRRNDALKPRHLIDKSNWKTTILTYKNNGNLATNFKASVGYHLNWTGHGIMVSSNNTIPWDNNVPTGATNPTGVLAYVNGGSGGNATIMVYGAINGETAKATGGATVGKAEIGAATLNITGYSETTGDWGGTIANGVEHNIVIEIVGNILKVYVAELPDQVLEVELNAGYQGGKVSAFSLGSDHGGITKFAYEDLEPEEPANANVTLNTKVKGDYTYVTLVTDTDGKFAGNVTFDSTKRSYVGAVNKELTFNRALSADLAEAGKVNVEAYGLAGKDAVTLVFTADGTDVSDIVYNPVFTVGGVKANVTTATSILGDINDDGVLNISDIIRYKKWEANMDGVTVNTAKFDINEDGVQDVTDLAYLAKTLVGTVDAPIESNLIGKSGLFLGDSIAYGAGDALRLSWGGRLRAYGLDAETVAVSAWSLAPTEVSGRGQIATQLDRAKKTAYDYVILEGGVNDILINKNYENGSTDTNNSKNIPMGEMTAPDNFTEFNTATVAGAMEDLVVKTKAKFPTAKVGYVINNSFSNIATNYPETYAAYVKLVKDVCEKHGIEVIDLSVLTNIDQPDNLHPSAAGYDVITPVIYEAMNSWK